MESGLCEIGQVAGGDKDGWRVARGAGGGCSSAYIGKTMGTRGRNALSYSVM